MALQHNAASPLPMPWEHMAMSQNPGVQMVPQNSLLMDAYSHLYALTHPHMLI